MKPYISVTINPNMFRADCTITGATNPLNDEHQVYFSRGALAVWVKTADLAALLFEDAAIPSAS